jgi:hypothetical protein
MADQRLVDAFLADDYPAIDPHLPEVMRLLNERRAGQSWHKHGTFKDHLVGTFRMLKLWGQPSETAYCGLFHSVYSNEYVDLALFDPAHERYVLRDLLGAETESLIYRFCTIPRTAFMRDVLARERIPADGLRLTGPDGSVHALDRRETGTYLVVTMADLLEQWYSWQEDTMSGYPGFGPVDAKTMWNVTLWPGQFRPGSSALSLVSRLARFLPDLDLPTPPVFDNCTGLLAQDDEAAAVALYWQVATQSTPHVSPVHARRILERAVALNPFVAEPRLLLAQIALLQDDFETAERHAEAGADLIAGWGIQWDKRIPWEGWTVWARLLASRARQRVWPRTLHEHNNLGLVPPVTAAV